MPPFEASESGTVVAFPCLSRVVGGDKLPGWDRWSPAAKIEHLFGTSLDRVHDCLGWSPHELDRPRPAAQSQAMRVVVMIAAKVGIELQRQAALDQERVDGLVRRVSGKDVPETYRLVRGKPGAGEERRAKMPHREQAVRR
jgi:hypothetical protein